MIVDHIQNHRQAPLMAGINQPHEPLRTSIRILHRERVNAIIAPVAIPRELSHRHDLNCGYAQILQFIQVWDDGVKGALRSKSPHMEFVNHIMGERYSGPVKLFPNKMGVNDLAWPMDAFGLELGGGVRTFSVPIETIKIWGSRLKPLPPTIVGDPGAFFPG